MRSDFERLKDIQEAILNIEKYSDLGKEEFLNNELLQSWILLHLQIIGEAARSTSQLTRHQYSEINWQDIIDFRNLLVHEYFRVDLKIVWKILESELPRLKRQIHSILERYES